MQNLNIIKHFEKKNYKNKINIIYQDELFFGGALKKAIKEFKGKNFLMMASDLETNPKDVKFLIRSSNIVEKKIICTSRWIKKNSFKNYNLVKLICNKIFQILVKLLFDTKLTDLTYGFRAYPRSYIKKMKLIEKKHPIMLEAILMPIKEKKKTIEIPTTWKARVEGKSNNSFMENFYYFKTLFRIFFQSKVS